MGLRCKYGGRACDGCGACMDWYREEDEEGFDEEGE